MAPKRLQESGAVNRQKKKQRDDAVASIAGSMNKYIQGGAHAKSSDQPSTSSSRAQDQLSAITSEPSTTSPSPDQELQSKAHLQTEHSPQPALLKAE